MQTTRQVTWPCDSAAAVPTDCSPTDCSDGLPDETRRTHYSAGLAEMPALFSPEKPCRMLTQGRPMPLRASSIHRSGTGNLSVGEENWLRVGAIAYDACLTTSSCGSHMPASGVRRSVRRFHRLLFTFPWEYLRSGRASYDRACFTSLVGADEEDDRAGAGMGHLPHMR